VLVTGMAAELSSIDYRWRETYRDGALPSNP
jgi:hypothetical protein